MKSPTGSGKTIMAAEFLRQLVGDPQFQVPKAYVWVSISDEIVMQSKKKLFKVYDGAGEVNLLDLNDLNSKKKMKDNNVFFVNWQKIKASTKANRKLRKDTEKSRWELWIFDEFIIATRKSGIDLVLIIDEAHMGSNTALSKEVEELIDPKIIFKITATPDEADELEAYRKGSFIETMREDVVREWLIKEKLVTQTEEDIAKLWKTQMDKDRILLELAYNKRLELVEHYESLWLDINPLVLVQIPNDDKADKESMQVLKADLIKEFLREKKVPDEEVAIWLSEKKENLDYVERNNSKVSFLIFKQAAATGWDCPRAGILVMYREIKKASFEIQTVGRILRMPEAKHYNIPELNVWYIYTNYERKDISIPDGSSSNKPAVFQSKRKDGINTIQLNSVYLGRTDYNDLWSLKFERVLCKSLNTYFGIDDSGMTDMNKNMQCLADSWIDITKTKITHDMIVDVEIENYDHFIQELQKKWRSIATGISLWDLERLFDLNLYNLIANQEQESRRYAPARSWKAFRNAFNSWFNAFISNDRPSYKAILINDLMKEDSKFRDAIGQALETFKPIRIAEVKEKESKIEQLITLTLPRSELFFTDDNEVFTDYELKRCSMTPLYVRKNRIENEIQFIKFLEEHPSIDWWYKNGDNGSDHFAIKYEDSFSENEKLFYPDWIAKLKDGKVLIVDTKAGITATSQDTADKAEALQSWIKTQEDTEIIWGIVVNIWGNWVIHNKDTYSVDKDYSEFVSLSDEL